MSPIKKQMQSILDELEVGSLLRKAGQTHQAREHFSQLIENQLPEDIKSDDPIFIRANMEAGMCAILTEDVPAALASFRHIENPKALTPEASLLYARAQLSGGDIQENKEVTDRLTNLMNDAEESLSPEISVMCQLLLSIAALQRNDLETTAVHLTTLLRTLELDINLSLIFTEKMRYFITDTEMNTLSQCEELTPLPHTILNLKKIDQTMPALRQFFFAPPKRKSSFSSFLHFDKEDPDFDAQLPRGNTNSSGW